MQNAVFCMAQKSHTPLCRRDKKQPISCKFQKLVVSLPQIIISFMSEKQKLVEKERRGVLELLLQKNGLKRKELVDFLLGVWVAGNVNQLSEEEKAQFPNLAF
jgi:hypothetical protein